MVLLLAVGFGVQLLWGYQQAPWWGLLAGLLVAPLIPAKAACRIRPPDVRETRDGSGAS